MKALFAITALAALAGPVTPIALIRHRRPSSRMATAPPWKRCWTGKKAVTQYNKDINAYVACIKLEHETAVTTAGDKLTPQQKADMEKMEVQKNNAAVDQLQTIADRFNGRFASTRPRTTRTPAAATAARKRRTEPAVPC